MGCYTTQNQVYDFDEECEKVMAKDSKYHPENDKIVENIYSSLSGQQYDINVAIENII